LKDVGFVEDGRILNTKCIVNFVGIIEMLLRFKVSYGRLEWRGQIVKVGSVTRKLTVDGSVLKRVTVRYEA